MVNVDESLLDDIPRHPGTYALLYTLSENRVIQVGKLGAFDFSVGFYLYIGSALGPGGLAGRIHRHMEPRKDGRRLHWHVDYLAAEATLTAIWYTQDSTRREHIWAQRIQNHKDTSIPVPKFGASDCRCKAHLFHFSSWLVKEDLQGSLEDRVFC